ncbi:hypothetical protein V2J09_007078 [Rumex salicifolius]
MLDAESPFTPLNGSLWPKATGRRVPLHPKNTPSNNNNSKIAQSNLKKFIPICPANFNNKENRPDFAPPATDTDSEVEVSPMDASLAEELDAVRKRLERLRMDRNTTERMLRLRDRVFEIRLQDFMLRGEFQKQLEVEVDRLYRLKQLQFHSMRVSPIKSLRERELQERTQEYPSQTGVTEVSY